MKLFLDISKIFQSEQRVISLLKHASDTVINSGVFFISSAARFMDFYFIHFLFHYKSSFLTIPSLFFIRSICHIFHILGDS